MGCCLVEWPEPIICLHLILSSASFTNFTSFLTPSIESLCPSLQPQHPATHISLCLLRPLWLCLQNPLLTASEKLNIFNLRHLQLLLSASLRFQTILILDLTTVFSAFPSSKRMKLGTLIFHKLNFYSQSDYFPSVFLQHSVLAL